jgi:hypothetical protein
MSQRFLAEARSARRQRIFLRSGRRQQAGQWQRAVPNWDTWDRKLGHLRNPQRRQEEYDRLAALVFPMAGLSNPRRLQVSNGHAKVGDRSPSFLEGLGSNRENVISAMRQLGYLTKEKLERVEKVSLSLVRCGRRRRVPFRLP